jgi:transposase
MRLRFGRKSEKLERQIEQLELRLEDLQQTQAAEQKTPSAASPSPESCPSMAPAKPARRPLPEHLPRQTQTHMPKHSACPDCGGELRKLSEDVSEMLEYVPESFRVIRHVRPKLSCQRCERIVQATAPSRPIARGLSGPGLLAHVLVFEVCGPSSPVSVWRDRRWQTGWGEAVHCWTRWWRRIAVPLRLRKTNTHPEKGSSASFSWQSWAKESMPFRPSTGSIATSTRICGVIWIIVPFFARHTAPHRDPPHVDESGEIAIPEIQRPFVWEATKVRNLLDSLYHGYPVGYLIAWRNPTVKLKDGTSSAGKRILIDGQQRVTAQWRRCWARRTTSKGYGANVGSA